MGRILILALGFVCGLAPASGQDADRVAPDEASDATALTVLRQICEVYAKASAMSYDIALTTYVAGRRDRIEATAHIAVAKPNLIRIDVLSDQPELEGTLVCDGEKVWQYAKKQNLYTSSPAPSDPGQIGGTLAGLPAFARQLPLAKDPYATMTGDGSIYNDQGTEKLDDMECRVIRRASKAGWFMLIWVDKELNLVRQTRLEYSVPAGRQVLILKRTKIRLDPKLSPDMFRFEPPSGSQAMPETPAGG
jgi:outer membrane lipoprotein-sorting protein